VRVLVDKRHLLTQDSTGEVSLWDVLAGQPIQQLGKVGVVAHGWAQCSLVWFQGVAMLRDWLCGFQG
jgi:hypothetical protein